MPPESRGRAPFVYAAKAHPEVHGAGADALVVTYVASSFDPEALLTRAGERALYWPRVVEVPALPCRAD